METPDKWIVIKIEHEGTTIYKVFASWYGGYLGSDSWRLNSGIKKVNAHYDDVYTDFIGYSESIYRCINGRYGTSSYSQGVLDKIIESATIHNAIITIMPESTNWLKLLE